LNLYEIYFIPCQGSFVIKRSGRVFGRFHEYFKKAAEGTGDGNGLREDHTIKHLAIDIILETAQEAIVVIQDGLNKYSNQKAAEISGYSIEELQDKPITETVFPDDYEKVIGAYSGRLQGDAIKYRHRITDKNGEIKFLESYGIRILWEGEPAALCFLTDVTAQITMEKALKEKTTIVEETNTALNVLLKHREKDLNEVEEKVVNNIKELVLPYIERLKALHLTPEASYYVDILEKHANEITSPFLMKADNRPKIGGLLFKMPMVTWHTVWNEIGKLPNDHGIRTYLILQQV